MFFLLQKPKIFNFSVTDPSPVLEKNRMYPPPIAHQLLSIGMLKENTQHL